MTADIVLNPGGHLRWREAGGEPGGRGLGGVRKAFDDDWREGLFRLAADRPDPGLSQTLRYWQNIANRFMTELRHLPQDGRVEDAALPDDMTLADWALSAPPMQGGEYLSRATLQGIWEALTQWCAERAAEAGGLAAFLEAAAPRWRQVGRVCFHLAENKTGPERPFAFLATCVSGLNASGQPRHLPLGRALNQYAEAKNRAALVKLLSPVNAAAERVEWVRQAVDSGEAYRPQAWTQEQAYRFLLSVPHLEESGLLVRVPDWWRRRPRPKVRATVGRTQTQLGAGALLDFDVQVALGDETLTPEEIEALLARGSGLTLLKGQWVEVDRERLQTAIRHWEELREQAGGDGLTFVEGMRLLAGASEDLKHEAEAEDAQNWAEVLAGKALRETLSRLRDPGNAEAAGQIGDGLQATLRPYQREGAAWLHFLAELGLGACLADDMGLGKTVQVLAALLHARRAGGAARQPSLLVVPASLLGNWRAEAERFAPQLRLEFLHPAEKDRAAIEEIGQAPNERLAGVDLAVTTYSMVKRQKWLADVAWRLVVLDEAQAIKNPGTAQTRAVKKLPARARVALTGTPVENRLEDLWSLFDFLNPGLLGSAAVFKSFVRALENRRSNQYAPLRRLTAPYILRRLKTDKQVISDLPEKIEATRWCNLTRSQARLYQQVVDAMQKALDGAAGMKRKALVLQTLMRLKQVCNHPSQLTGDGAFTPADSGKFLRLAELCEELAERQERVLVFTQFREIIDPLAERLAGVFGRPGLTLHGGTGVAKRRRLVEDFQREDGPPFFIVSLKAGGTGLNLTAASHVVHFDRWWNPAVEDQATDRAFRIGQKRNVLVHKFVTSGSVEERIDEMIAAKRKVAAEALAGGAEKMLTEMNDDELVALVRLDVDRAVV